MKRNSAVDMGGVLNLLLLTKRDGLLKPSACSSSELGKAQRKSHPAHHLFPLDMRRFEGLTERNELSHGDVGLVALRIVRGKVHLH